MYFKNEALLRETEADFSDPNSQVMQKSILHVPNMDKLTE